jgi:hypothetical protein
MFKDKNELITNMVQGLDDGTLVPPKHSISSLGTPAPKYKTVVVPDTNDLKAFFKSGDYSAKLYKNNDPKHSDPYVVIKPNDASYVSASGVPPMSPYPTHPCDVFVSVSGVRAGLHLYGEESANVQAKLTSGKITFVQDLL